MYTDRNFKSKKELKAAVKAWNTLIVPSTLETQLTGNAPRRSGPAVTYYQPFAGDTPRNGTIYCEGPHYPAPHRWYAQCEARNGAIVKVK